MLHSKKPSKFKPALHDLPFLAVVRKSTSAVLQWWECRINRRECALTRWTSLHARVSCTIGWSAAAC